ncbi:serine protease, partial [Veronia nyctiphanis]
MLDQEGLEDSVTSTVTVQDDATTCDVKAWSATTSYSKGDRVSFKGHIYEAVWWSTGAAPDVYSNVW